MSSFDTTDVDTIRDAMAERIQTIVPRYAPRKDDGWTWTKDQEIAGGGTLRTFDLIFESEVDSPQTWHGGGIALVSTCEIRVSYPVSEALVERFRGADGQDLAGLLVRIHAHIPGMFPVSMSQDRPVFEQLRNGQTGAYVGSFFVDVHFFASDALELSA